MAVDGKEITQRGSRRIHDRTVGARFDSQQKEDIVDQMAAGQAEGDVGEAASDVDFGPQLVAQLADGVKGVVAELRVNRDGEDQGVNVEVRKRQVQFLCLIDHAPSVVNSFLSALRHTGLASRRDDNLGVVSFGQR